MTEPMIALPTELPSELATELPTGPSTAVTRGVYLVLGVLAAALATLQLTAPQVSVALVPPLFGLAAGVGAVVLLHTAAGLSGRSRRPWQAGAAAGAFLAVGQAITVVTDGSIERGTWGDLSTLLAVPAVVAACLLLLPQRSGRRIGSRMVLDGAVVLVAIALLGTVLLRDVVPLTDGVAAALITVGYPAVGASLCGVALVTLARAETARRRAAGWLLVSVLAMVVVAVSGALGRVLGSTGSAVATQIAWMVMLAAVVRAAEVDPGESTEAGEQPVGLPLLGFFVSTVAGFIAGGFVIVGLIGGRMPAPPEAVGLGALVLLLFLRQLLWARDGASLTAQLQRTEAYFRALVNSAEDVTVVVDRDGVVTWLSGSVRRQLGWNARDLTGRDLAELLHADDRGVLPKAAAVLSGAPATDLPATVRLRTQDGGWRDIEVSGAARAGVPGTALRENLVLHLRDVTARRTSQRELERMAYADYLTGLPNRARFMAALEEARAAAAAGSPACVLLVDLDGFKAVNDLAGHDAGDRLLCEVADLLRAGAREEDLVARLGGDEFALLVPGDKEEGTGLAERLVELLGRPFRLRSADGVLGPVFAVSGSIGLAELVPDDAATATIRQADLALRAAKAAGKSCVRTSGQAIDSAMGRRTRLARDLPAALEQEQLRLVYQPVAGLAEHRIFGLEALVRWDHPLLGTIPPDDFISLAEDDGLIVPLQRWVLSTALADLAVLRAAGHELQMGVNVSVRHLQAGCLAPDVARALADSAVPPGNLVLEVTESVMLDPEERLESDLATVREMGCVIALDDFGRGYSSLAYLSRLPVDILKLDREFVADIEGDPRLAALVATIVDLGRTLGMDVVAEGVETPGQLAALRDMGCGYVQGYLVGRPVPFAELPALLDSFDVTVLEEIRPTESDVVTTS